MSPHTFSGSVISDNVLVLRKTNEDGEELKFLICDIMGESLPRQDPKSKDRAPRLPAFRAPELRYIGYDYRVNHWDLGVMIFQVSDRHGAFYLLASGFLRFVVFSSSLDLALPSTMYMTSPNRIAWIG